ncbi:MAG: RdgB/HAM1 family non-canonical purine NTP pyrophosphatase [Pyrinomonadaceae bacterium]
MKIADIDRLVLATSNQGKLTEVRRLLLDLPVTLLDLHDFPNTAEPEENGLTFEDNSRLKAAYYARHTGGWTIADDSGLEVTCLNHEPGVHSARFGGSGRNDADRISLLLQHITASGATDRSARFVCSITLAEPAGAIVKTFTATCEGRIAEAPRGTNGFGYDPVFAPLGFDLTFGELPESVKQKLSHRARALALFRKYLLDSFTLKA